MSDWRLLLPRVGAIALAAAAIADPACTRQREAPLPIVVRSASRDVADVALAERIRTALTDALGERIDLHPSGAPGAIVIAGATADPSELPEGVPVSVVTESGTDRRNIRVAGASSSRVMLPGLAGIVSAQVEAIGAAGERSIITLEHNAIELARVEHRWQSDAEVFEARFDYVPPSPGVRVLRVIARPLDSERTTADNHADLQVAAEDRKLRILVHEPRPSWTMTFIRRTLEGEPIFDVAALTRPSPGIHVRAGAAPERLRSDRIADFDAIVVGAPEELRPDEIDALTWFARIRGGAFILAPDRRPSGAYVSMIPAQSFQERLLESPAAIAGSALTLRATEFAVAVGPGPAVERIADLRGARNNEPVVFAWPLGEGTGMFVGALDAWRHRGRAEEFGAFWRAHVARAAAGSPRRLGVTLTPGVASPGEKVTLRARLRATEIDARQGTVELPAVAARLVRADGTIEPIRLWPLPETGTFEGVFEAPAEGRHVVQASAGGSTVDAALVVSAGSRSAGIDAPVSTNLLASTTGGVRATSGDLSPLVAHLRALPLPATTVSVHPARSAWWMAAVVLLVCAEWFLRRRKGLT